MRHTTLLLAASLFALGAASGFGGRYALQQHLTTPAMPTPPAVRTLAAWLRLDAAQTKALAEVDPNFESDRAALEAELARAREQLAKLFEDGDSTSEAIQQQVEVVVEAQSKLEHRVADYLLALRPHLTEAQRHELFKQCAHGIREAGRGGPRWRGGAGAEDGADRPGHGGPPGSGGGGRQRGRHGSGG